MQHAESRFLEPLRIGTMLVPIDPARPHGLAPDPLA